MRKIEMVRCFVISPNDDSRTARYIPFDIFQLWKYLMESQNRFIVSDERVSVWMDEEMYSREANRLPPHTPEKVMEISFMYIKESEVGRSVVRYFPNEDYKAIKGYFLKNFSEEHIREVEKETQGFFILRS